MRHISVCNTFQAPTVISISDVKKTTAWGESGFPARFLVSSEKMRGQLRPLQQMRTRAANGVANGRFPVCSGLVSPTRGHQHAHRRFCLHPGPHCPHRVEPIRAWGGGTGSSGGTSNYSSGVTRKGEERALSAPPGPRISCQRRERPHTSISGVTTGMQHCGVACGVNGGTATKP